MQKQYVHIGIKVIALALLLPCLYGCKGGGGGGSSASLSSFAFGGGDDTDSLSSILLDSSSNSGTENSGSGTTTDTVLATLHQPEPATMLLFGSGIVAMRFARNRKNSLTRDQKR